MTVILFAVGLFLLFRPGEVIAPSGPAVTTVPTGGTKMAQTGDGDDVEEKSGEPTFVPMQIDPLDAAQGKGKDSPRTNERRQQQAKATLDQAEQVYLAADSAWQQRRNWRLANEGRLRAMAAAHSRRAGAGEAESRSSPKLNYDAARRVYQQTP